MEKSNSIPTQNIEKKGIIKAVIIAFISGMLLLIVAVLPAEYGIDPIGTGKLFGFSKLYVPDEDDHGEVKQKVKPKQTYYDSYTIATANNMVGSLLAPFEGSHGWYFRNSSSQDVVVKLKLKGQYTL